MNEVSLQQVVACAEQRRAALPCELAAYLTLAITEQAATSVAKWDSGEIWLTEDGRLRVGAGQSASEGICERSIRGLLAWMLMAASSVSPALLRISRSEHQSGLDSLLRELETSLIPVNRGAARRALARLYREVQRAVESGLNPPISRPPDLSCRDEGSAARQESLVRPPPPVEVRTDAPFPPPVGEASRGADAPAKEKSPAPSRNDAIPDLEIPEPGPRNDAHATQGANAQVDPKSPHPLRTVRLDEVRRGGDRTDGYPWARPTTVELEPRIDVTEPLKASECRESSFNARSSLQSFAREQGPAALPIVGESDIAAICLEQREEIFEIDPDDVVEVEAWSDTSPPALATRDSTQQVAAELVDVDIDVAAVESASIRSDDPLPFDTWLDAPVESIADQAEPDAVPSQPVVPLAQPYSAPPRFPRRASEVEDLTAGFTVTREPASPDLSGDLRRAAGIDPSGHSNHLRSETPPPAIRDAADRDSDQSNRHFGTRTLLGLGGAVTAMAAVALVIVRGHVGMLPAAAAAPVAAPEPTETCSAVVRVLQVEPGVAVRVREADGASLRPGRRISPSEVSVEGLQCGKSAELLLYGPTPGVLRRIPIDGEQLQPSAESPAVEAIVVVRRAP